jgi:hypothetical protein
MHNHRTRIAGAPMVFFHRTRHECLFARQIEIDNLAPGSLPSQLTI